METFILRRGMIFVFALSLFSLTQTTNSWAQYGDSHRGRPHDDHFYHHPYHPFYYPRLPLGYISLAVADATYYYLDGVYYSHTPSGYVVVAGPRGARIRALPERHKVIVYDNTDYYYYNNTYYVKQADEYAVVTPPPPVVSSNAQATEAPEKSVTVTVPNANGSYMPITLQKYSDGYVGPNGEFYPNYPTVEQLKAMYSKTSAVADAPEKEEELEYNIPNSNGSFTKVKILKSKDGYVGPEGEFYPQKPTIEQLKVMYAKG